MESKFKIGQKVRFLNWSGYYKIIRINNDGSYDIERGFEQIWHVYKNELSPKED